jgi:hypothetical protein
MEGRRSYGGRVSRSAAQSWSLTRSLLFLAATFAMVFGTLLPAAVAASPATGTAIMLCSGDEMLVSYGPDGEPRPEKPSAMDSLKCASCVLAALAGLPPSPPIRPVSPPRITSVQPTTVWTAPAPSLTLADWRPPATAPPLT